MRWGDASGEQQQLHALLQAAEAKTAELHTAADTPDGEGRGGGVDVIGRWAMRSQGSVSAASTSTAPPPGKSAAAFLSVAVTRFTPQMNPSVPPPLPCPRATRPRNMVLSYSSAAGAALAAARARSAALACRFRYLPPYATVHVCERATSNTRRTLHGRGCYRKTRFVNLSVANGTAIGFLGARLNASTRASSSRLHDRSTVP